MSVEVISSSTEARPIIQTKKEEWEVFGWQTVSSKSKEVSSLIAVYTDSVYTIIITWSATV